MKTNLVSKGKGHVMHDVIMFQLLRLPNFMCFKARVKLPKPRFSI